MHRGSAADHHIVVTAPDITATIPARKGETLLDAFQRAGWHFPAPCGGIGRCGKCAVTVENPDAAGARHTDEQRWLGDDPARRLACRCVPEADLRVRVDAAVKPPVAADTLAKGGGIELATTGAPVVTVQIISLEAPTLADQRSLHRRIVDSLCAQEWCESPPAVSPALLSRSASLFFGVDHPATLAVVLDAFDSTSRVLDIRPGERTDLAGLAVDVGTTTVAAYLIDLADHEVIAAHSAANAQGSHGADVISRIHAAAGGAPLTQIIRRQIGGMAAELARAAGIRTQDILAASVVGNTTMMHLLLGMDPDPISRAPFTAVSTEQMSVPAAELGWQLHGEACVRILPGISGYVGADIVADLLACELHPEAEAALLIDIGTNGEIVLRHGDEITCCSTAAGPAFEGASIRHGLGGVAGAINHVRRVGPELEIRTIGEAPPIGICGTGLMDAVALFLDDGLLDETGRLDFSAVRADAVPAWEGRLVDVEGEPAVVLAAADTSRPRIVLTQADIRQIQLGKGAIAAGVETLFRETGTGLDAVSRVYLAGGFGTYVRPESALRIGLLPQVGADRIVSVGNAAGAGAARTLVDHASMAEAVALAARCRYLELSGSAVFQTAFVEHMMFPG